MAWSKLSSRLDKLPTVLAGPILRQVTPDAATVWVALKRKADVTLTIYDKDTGTGRKTLMSATRTTATVGKNLHIVAVTARAKNTFSEGNIYFYDLQFRGTDPAIDQNLVTGITRPGASPDSSRLVYKPHALPSFVLPPSDLNKLRLMHGSCRKPHGGGPVAPDAMAMLDDLIADSARDAFNRPHQLVLTGDQIYADEVEDTLLVALTDAGDTLLGWAASESMPGVASDGPYEAAKLLPTTRTNVIEKAGLTSEDTRSHLMSLGEYLAMYLFAWSEELWTDLPTLDELKSMLPSGVSISDKVAQEIKEHQPAIDNFRKALPAVRRALANIPTYMICDDHDVTDDWNMTRRFCQQVYGNPLGLRVIQNALIAYSICQAWGNLPEQFANDPKRPPGAQLLQSLETVNQLPKGNATAYEGQSAALRTILGLHPDSDIRSQSGDYRVFHDTGFNIVVDGKSLNDKSLRYDFTIEGPSHQIIVTDSRTWRSFPQSDVDGHPSLIPENALFTQLLNAPSLGDRVLLVVFTTNIPPIASRRVAAGMFHSKSRVHGHDLGDDWEFPALDFDRLIARLSDRVKKTGDTRTGAVVFLSGDCHYSFSTRLAYLAESERLLDMPGKGEKAAIVFAQLVASPFKNESAFTRGMQKDGYRHHDAWYEGMVIPPQRPEAYVGWNVQVGSILVGSRDQRLLKADENQPTLPLNLNEDPVHKPSNEVDGNPIKPIILREKPHYRYRLDYLATSQHGQGAPPEIERIDMTTLNSAQRSYVDQARAYIKQQQKGVLHPDCVGYNNLGEIAFVWLPDDKSVNQTLYWRQPGESKPFWARYHVSLMIRDPEYKPIPADKEP